MITRGLIIGKIVDDIAGLKYQIQTRNKLQLYDLTKVIEDFSKQVLNIVYNLNLINLNTERVNTPGIDLGDKINKIAYQITSAKYSPKIKATLEAITASQKVDYKTFKVFIVGEKATSYTIDDALLNEFSFEIEQHIVDFDDLLKDIMVADITILDLLYSLFQREFRQVKIELEPVDFEGGFQSSLYNQIEKIPSKKPVNANKLAELFDDCDFDDSTVNLNTIQELYSKLSKIPRVTRELIPIIIERGAKRGFNHSYNEYGILPQILKNSLRLTDSELNSEIAILFDADLIYFGENHIGEVLYYYITLTDMTINVLIDWALENDIPIRKMFNTMDWTILDD
jgi:hypothetical protein